VRENAFCSPKISVDKLLGLEGGQRVAEQHVAREVQFAGAKLRRQRLRNVDVRELIPQLTESLAGLNPPMPWPK
jgi:hypothetical protein